MEVLEVMAEETRTFDHLDPWRSSEHGTDGAKWELVDVVLTGGAPWGFSLRGGLEYQEPLVITKVEEGSCAASARLQVGDEIVGINAIPLSGYRQEAICLVKSSYKTLALELKRRNETLCRHQSWHSTKGSETTSELFQTEATTVLEPAGQISAANSSSNDFTSCWGQKDLQHCLFSSVANMERIEQSSNKPQTGADHSLAGRGVYEHNSFSSCTAEQSDTAASECMFYQGSLSESHRYLQVPVSNGSRTSARSEEQSISTSSSGRMSLNPVWHIPEKSSAHSPPPPLPPLRSDSVSATKVHEKESSIPYSQGPPPYSSQKTHSRVTDRQFDDYHVGERGPESRRSYNPLSKKDFLHVHLPAEEYSPNQLKTNKSLSSSTTDVRQAQNPFACQPQHQRQLSDEFSFNLQPRNACVSKTQSVGSYYSSLQTIPNNEGVHHQARGSAASKPSAAHDHNPDEQAHFRYYCTTAQQPTTEGKVENEWRPESDTVQDGSGQKPENSQRAIKSKHPPPYLQAPEIKGCNEHYKQTVCPPEATSLGPCAVMVKSNSNEKEKENPWRKDRGIAENQHIKHMLYHQTEQRNLPTIAHGDTLRDPWISRDQLKICPHKTPLLHSLAQESQILANSTMVSTSEVTQQDTSDPSSGKLGRRSDRYATTLRNEIQEKRAQLQKSRSAASLSYTGENQESSGVWKSTETSTSSSDSSFTNTYKDFVKEAQAKVLQATSFKRRDLELPGNESSTKACSTNGQVLRIGSRKRFPVYKRLLSFSEPEKINEVGVKEKISHHMAGGSFEDKCKFFEGASRPAFSRPVRKKSSLSFTEDNGGGRNKLSSFIGDGDRKSKDNHGNRGVGAPVGKLRLGTFAEYEATWNLQRKLSEGRTSSKYRSAENILDAELEERIGLVCVHERSKSSPSTDFQGDKPSVPAQKSMEVSHPRCKRERRESYVGSASNRRHSELNISEPLELNTVFDQEHRNITAHILSVSPTKVASLQPPHPHHLQGPVFEQLLPSENNGPAPQRPAQLSITRSGTTCPSPFLEALPNKGHPQEKSPCTLPALWKNSRSETEDPLPAVALVASPHSPSPHWSAEVLSSPHDDLQRKLVHNSSEHSSGLKKSAICDVHAESKLETESRHYLAHGDVAGGPDETSVQVSPVCSPERPHVLSRVYPHRGQQRDSDISSSEAQTPVGTIPDNTKTTNTNSAPAELSEEDEKREELARDIMERDKRLVDILDQRKMKTTMDLMEGIYPQGEHLLEGGQQRRKASVKQSSSKTAQERVDDRMAVSVSLVTSSSYYSTSAPKAELLIKMKDMQEQMKEQECEDELDLLSKKELMDSLARKLQVLREARESLQEDMRDNDALGEQVGATVQAVCKPNELDRFCMFVGDLDKVVSLLLSLSGRLARVENALDNLEESASAEEKHTLMEKRKLLIRQHDDAKELKENLDRRARVVHDILEGYLSKEHLADYQHFVKMKAALIIEQRKLEDRIKLGEEQLKCLKDSLPPGTETQPWSS